MRLKSEYVEKIMSCPFTGKMINTTLLNPNMYHHWISKGYGYMFEAEPDLEAIDESVFFSKKSIK